jgi:hypothetical protein
VDVAGHVIPGGLFYVGGSLGGVTGGVEPALVDPELPVTSDGRGPTAVDLGPVLAYHLISPAARGAYLRWLAGGRRTDAPAGLVQLFCLGLERRVLHDDGHDTAVRGELPAIAAEVWRLRERYGRAPDLSDRLSGLMDLLDVLAAPRRAVPGAAVSATRSTPMRVRVALSRFAASGTPVPVDWARVWVRHHPLVPPRRVQALCPAEFDHLFTARYRDAFGPGLVPSDDVPGLRLRYQPAHQDLGVTLVRREDLPDVLSEPRAGRLLGRLVDDVAGELDPYCRMVARFPHSQGSLAATALLPADLLDADRGPFGALRVWTEARFNGRPLAVVDGAEFAAFWSTAAPGRMARDEAEAFIEVMALLGVGVEPDVRFGGPALGPGPVVLFRSGVPVWQRPAAASRRAGAAAEAARPGPGFAAAAAIARCAAVVTAAAGPVVPHGAVWVRVLDTVTDLAVACGVAVGHRPRLAARLVWLLATGVAVDRLPRQVTRLGEPERETAGRWLISLAAAVAPGFPHPVVAALSRVYRVLGLDVDLLFSRLHAFSVGGPQPAGVSDEPVLVRAADPDRGGFTLPWTASRDPGGPSADAEPRPGDDLRLDLAVVNRTAQESEAVAALLGTIFDSDTVDSPAAGTAFAGADPITGLDRAHSGLLRALAERSPLTRDEFAALAGAHGVLPDGAVDVLNEAAIDTVGEPVVLDGATLTVDDDVLQELLR